MTEENPKLSINKYSSINIEINKEKNENTKINININELNKDFKISNKRQYGIDLLRIFAMFMVINTHLGNCSDFTNHITFIII